jgi:hypothetical protein
MGVTTGIFLASILLKEMRYLVYIRYLWLRGARRKEGLHGTIGFLGSSIRIETGASDWLTLVDKITKNSKCQQQHFEL